MPNLRKQKKKKSSIASQPRWSVPSTKVGRVDYDEFLRIGGARVELLHVFQGTQLVAFALNKNFGFALVRTGSKSVA